jgi:hypothetical protein
MTARIAIALVLVAVLPAAVWGDASAGPTSQGGNVRSSMRQLWHSNVSAMRDSSAQAAAARPIEVAQVVVAPPPASRPASRPTTLPTTASAPASRPTTAPSAETLAYLKSLPGGAVNLMALADDLYAHEKHELALAVYERVLAVAANEDKPWLLFQIANCRRHTDVPQAALAAYGRVVSECPKTLWADLAAAQVQLLQWRGANDIDALLKSPAKAQGIAE